MSDLPQAQAMNNAKIAGGEPPHSPDHGKFLAPSQIPSPIPTRRSRTYSQSERAAQGKTYKGKVKDFCRSKGHGFIINDDSKEEVFVHISDIDGEYCPKPNDEVSYKLIPLPFKPEKYQAVHVVITHLAPGVSHEKWSSSNTSPNMSPRT